MLSMLWVTLSFKVYFWYHLSIKYKSLLTNILLLIYVIWYLILARVNDKLGMLFYLN